MWVRIIDFTLLFNHYKTFIVCPQREKSNKKAKAAKRWTNWLGHIIRHLAMSIGPVPHPYPHPHPHPHPSDPMQLKVSHAVGQKVFIVRSRWQLQSTGLGSGSGFGFRLDSDPRASPSSFVIFVIYFAVIILMHQTRAGRGGILASPFSGDTKHHGVFTVSTTEMIN